MALNLNRLPKANSDMAPQELLDIGNYPGRVVQIIDLGLQAQRPFKGKEKPPAYEVNMTYELADEFMKDKEGNELEDKPRWLSERFPVYSLQAENSKSTKRYLALDPKQDHGGDLTALIECPCNVTVVHNESGGKTYANVGGISAMRAKDAEKAPPLKNEAKVFTLDDPDMEVYNSLPEYLRKIIEANLEFEGSKLQKLLGGKVAPKEEQKAKPAQEEEEEENSGQNPW